MDNAVITFLGANYTLVFISGETSWALNEVPSMQARQGHVASFR